MVDNIFTVRILPFQKTQRLFATATFGVLLCGCATPKEIPVTDSFKPIDQDILAPRFLQEGDCGLFVWIGETPEFRLFTDDAKDTVYADNGQEVPLLSRETLRQADSFNQITKQEFQDGAGKAYFLDLQNPHAISGGIHYRSGVWRYFDENNWSLVKPAFGVSTCLDDRPIKAEDFVTFEQLVLNNVKSNSNISLAEPFLDETLSEEIVTSNLLEQTKEERPEFVSSPSTELVINPPIITLPKASYQVQLMSLRSGAKALEAWDNLASQYTYLRAYPVIIEQADIPGKGVFSRLKLGPFETYEDAQTLCDRHKESGEECFVVRLSGS